MLIIVRLRRAVGSAVAWILAHKGLQCRLTSWQEHRRAMKFGSKASAMQALTGTLHGRLHEGAAAIPRRS